MTEPATNSKPRKVPAWSLMPFDELTRYIEKVDILLTVSINASKLVPKLPEISQHLRNYEEVQPNSDIADISEEEEIGLPKKVTDLINKENDRGFPLLHSQTIILLWGALETCIKDFLILCLVNEPEAWTIKEIQNIRITIGEYETLDQEDKCAYIIDSLERDLKAKYKRGITRFEALLEVFGYSGTIIDETKQIIFEIQQVRNLIVHRRGIVDRKFITACPWLYLQIGSELTIDHQTYVKYREAIINYVEELLYRVGDHYGRNLRLQRPTPDKGT